MSAGQREIPQSINVRVAGKQYRLRSTLDSAAVDRAVGYINRHLQETHAINPGTDGETAAIAVALHLAGELVQAQDDNVRLHRMLVQQHEQNS